MAAEERGRKYEEVDFNNDGIIDCYVYSYSYIETSGWLWWKKAVVKEGKVYFYINKSDNFFNNADNIPKGINYNSDLMIGDYTAGKNPNLKAYQAHKVDPEHRGDIIDIMQQYDEDFNTPWDRSKDDTLMIEWEAHHKYSLFKRAQDIDFDNDEEDKDMDYFDQKAIDGFKKMVQKFISNLWPFGKR